MIMGKNLLCTQKCLYKRHFFVYYFAHRWMPLSILCLGRLWKEEATASGGNALSTLKRFGEDYVRADFSRATLGSYRRIMVPLLPVEPGGELPKGASRTMDLGKLQPTQDEMNAARRAAGVINRYN
ncbi:MAG: hypothetical protein CO030_00105 [Candidatus Magasanikbacteria bacterium CG_4_9_14_0_2_um_filter_42_11]|uniref:Uncharacterized protein n=1 Tax=Candidatus Magasanikbacteria bacterium CG_4_9_14_0_2_um_filter_42_11 TaxID=1974643 RepID=A0A2M8FB79_9BACT|nr:MAG: hypothetical protein COU34_01435 [Candidatus Magasanikbacteria bacterium CG10_big_fil_rev_8_21_14_0_10_43_9]PIY92052.1 MAG: hypothetical protein COY70_05265 [Candidatus Magasanikbacteria bacterium CG_4_10_14_0_8_um_filter_42_12]PJC52971.1 MAG: hypothetical protein CO030_00105 [Candidatus Magasanikbacteria bacterium CG_4_9_14_0_2_um_filter_42_11]